MTARDVLIIVGTAAVTLALALAPWHALPPANATGEPAALALPQPAAIEFNGLKLSLSLDKRTYATGDAPVVTLTATNTTGQAVSLDTMVTLMATDAVSPWSRMMPLPKQRWSQPCSIALQPGETRTYELRPAVPLPSGATGSVALHSGGKALTAAHFTVARPALKAVTDSSAAAPKTR